MRNKRSYDGAYKPGVVQMTRQPGRTVTGVDKEPGIPWKTRVRARPVSRDARLRPVSGWVGRWNKQGAAAFFWSL